MTIKTKRYYDTRVKNCPTCNKFFNPFSKRGAMASCCGNTWKIFQTVDVELVMDNGRDEKGRFHHAPKIISKTVTDL